MLINILKYNIRPKGVIHVGAHLAQEHETYLKIGCKRVAYIEPSTEAYEVLKRKFDGNNDVTIIHAACGAKVGKAVLNIERQNQGQSNSILPMGTHLTQHPGIFFTESEEVPVFPLDVMDCRDYDFLMIDVQGYEGEVLKGAVHTLKKMNWVYCEINREEVYKGCMLVDGIDELLHEFTPVHTEWCGGWGDRLYKRKT